MASMLSKPMTADEFYDFVNRLKNRDRHFELEDGEVVEEALPGELHCVVCGVAAALLVGYTRQVKSGHVCSNNVGLVLSRDPDTVYGPDIALFSGIVRFKDLETSWPKRLPKLIVEVLSPNDRQGKMQKRINKFLEKGVGMAWLLDPEEETLTIFLPNRQPIVLEGDEEVAGLKALPEFRCKVADFFTVAGE
ncbi:MAG TPA: Uma2 family endonuclease [Gemmataceae bacterium]|nr:Uma2 family endonuclease [Gemmataceae bacterium]